MQGSVVLAIWAAAAFVLYKITGRVLIEFKHHRNAKQRGCQDPPRFIPYDYFGLYGLYQLISADGKGRVVTRVYEFWQAARKREGLENNRLTFRYTPLGARTVTTIEPRNIQAILATQFKDFGLGKRRNGNFAPLLGKGIVSVWVLGIIEKIANG